uniref:Uncharacterized protein n=1 Tax=Brassica oleracea TaxID=3712 RepID=A0A3P6GQE5_BRAOL|nr:unnamed protein product [Brassica oleracea]
MLNHPCLRNQWTKRKQDESPRISDENSNKAGSNNSETEVIKAFFQTRCIGCVDEEINKTRFF